MSMSGSRASRKAIQQEVLIGRTLQQGKYLIEAMLGHGGMGKVFLASHDHLDVPLAIKQVRADEPLPPDVIEELDQLLHSKGKPPHITRGDFPLSGGTNTDRFLREALLLARLHHPAIPLLYDYFLENGSWYLVMEYVPGATLSVYMREHVPLPPLEAVNYTLQICDVLDYLHRQNPPVVFRDLKPANIILHPDGRLMIVDFGIARYFKEGQYNDTTDFGSPGYASPEQYEGLGQTDARSDLFSLGVILHEMLSGQRPTRRNVTTEHLEALNKLHPAISPALSGLVMVATRTEPMYRFQSAHTFYQALERVRAVEERRAYRYHAFLAGSTALQRTPAFPLIPPPSSQGFINSELAREQDLRTQRMRMREQPHRNTQRVNLEQEALAHQMTSIDESLKMRVVSSPLTRSGHQPTVMPTMHLNSNVAVTEAPIVPGQPPILPPTPHLSAQLPAPRKRRRGMLIFSLCMLLLLLSSSLLIYYYTVTHSFPVSQPHTASPTPFARQTQATRDGKPLNPWQSLPALPSAEADNTALSVQVHGQTFIYMTAGYWGAHSPTSYNQGLYRYTPATARWEKVNVANFPLMANNAAATDGQGDLFFTGGYSPTLGAVSPHLYLYQIASNTLSSIALPAQISVGLGSSMFADQQGHLYLTEGFLTPDDPTAQAGLGWYRYDIASGLWHVLANLPVGLGYAQLAPDDNGNIFLLGGASDAGQHTLNLSIYRYNSQQDAWSLASTAAPAPLSGAESCADGKGRLVLIGGYTAAPAQSLRTAWLLNLQRLSWQSLAALPGGGSQFGTAACDGLGHVYVTRGAKSPTQPTTDFFKLTLPG
jgi:serine/threonine protein kinase